LIMLLWVFDHFGRVFCLFFSFFLGRVHPWCLD
jgi:hypothetical protein